MNNLVKMAIFLVVVFTAGSLQHTIGQTAAAQLDPIVTTPPATTAPKAQDAPVQPSPPVQPTTPTSPVQPSPPVDKNTIIKEGLTNIFDIYQVLAGKDTPSIDVMLKLNNLEKILIQLMR
jgi:hypothetical protein